MKISFDISIIVCCYSGETTIEACLGSLIRQTRDKISIEVILVDDGSRDGTSRKISGFLKSNSNLINLQIKYFRKDNEGLSTARNYGVNKSQAKIVAFIDEDAVADEKFSKTIVRLFQENQNVNCIGGTVELLNIENSFAKMIQNSFFSLEMKSKSAVIGTNMAFRKSLISEIGGFQPEFTYRGDESALFAKAKGRIILMKSEKVIVRHQQPPNFYRWLKMRYENGYFTAAVYDLAKLGNLIIYRQLIIIICTLFVPVFIAFCFIFNNFTTYPILVLLLSTLLLLKRYVINKRIKSFIKEYFTNVNEKKKLAKAIYIGLLASTGYFVRDYGYLKGYLKYRNYEWQ